MVQIDLVVTAGLGDNSYVLSIGDEALAVDPQRDVARLIEAATARGARIRRVLETHVHNDYVSGALELREATGAEIVAPADGGYAFGVRGVHEGDEILVGDHRLVALETPGHTPEHLSFLLFGEGPDPVALFSGGSLIVGNAGRTDLLGADRVDDLVRAQFRSVRRLAELPDEVTLLPTHGAGSFCASGPPSGPRTSTIGTERRSNRALLVPDETRFRIEQLAGLPAYPSYYEEMAPINRAGPRVLGHPPALRSLSADEIVRELDAGAWLIDTRDGADFAAAHVPGSLDVPLEDSFGSYVGWLVPFDARIALLTTDDDGTREAAMQLFRIGYDRLIGVLHGGIDGWRASGREVASFPAISSEDLARELAAGDRPSIVDVRQATEWREGHLEGSRHVFVGDVPDELGTFDRADATTVICASGYRSSMAASLLSREGLAVRLVASDGVPRVRELLAT